MKVILLLAGRSRRFWPLEDKYLFPLLGKTVLEHQLERLKAAGCTDLILVAGKHNIDAVKLLAPKATIVEQKDLDAGMRGALLDALPQCKNKPVLIVGSDLIDPKAYRTLKNKLEHERVDGLLLARKVKRYFPGGYLTLQGRKIVGIVEKPGEGKEPSDLVNIVAHAHRDASVLLRALLKTRAKQDSGYEAALSVLFKTGRYDAVPYEGPWHPVKYPWHLLELLPFLLSLQTKKSIHRTASVHRTAVIEGPVVIAEGARILPHTTVVGPSYIGPHTIVGNGSLIRGASIGSHGVIGYNTEVKGSALADHVWTHSTYIGDSVIGNNVAFGGGSVTGNLRLDEEEVRSAVGKEDVTTGLRKFGTIIGNDVRIGIHVSINPGVKVGPGSFIGSAALLHDDVPSGAFVTMAGSTMHIRENKKLTPQPGGRKEFRKKL